MKKTVFLTGATGNMGWAGFQELYRRGKFRIRILARNSKKNRKKLAPYLQDPSVDIIWGDLLNYEDILQGVTGADYILHVGGMVSPAADLFPEETLKVNVTSAMHIVKAVLAQPDAERIRVVYIGSVSQYGDRRSPVQWGSTGDPSFASQFDMYSVSKCLAEKVIADSGIKHWVSLRQSGILYPGILKVVNSTAFHVPLAGVLEWATIEDSGRVLANVCEDFVPEEFWNRFYNISSGPDYRMSNYEFESRLLRTVGLPGPEKIFEPQWFALKNFHGMWYTDAELLENYLHFRANVPLDLYFKQMKKKLPWYFSLAFLVPAFLVKLYMKKYAYQDDTCTQWWVKHDPEKVKAYYGSREAYDRIKSWDDVRPIPLEKDLARAKASGQVVEVDRGYDISKPLQNLSLEELRAAAAFRGGKFIGPEKLPGTPGQLFEWECEHGHRFQASLEYVLLGGGWCQDCELSKVMVETTEKNRFISQITAAQHQE